MEDGIAINNRTLIWVDTQGHEGQVLSGGSTVFSSPDQPFLVLEFWPYAIEIAGGRQCLLDSLRSYGVFYDINQLHWQERPMEYENVVALYETLRVSANDSDQPFTDILCVPHAIESIN